MNLSMAAMRPPTPIKEASVEGVFGLLNAISDPERSRRILAEIVTASDHNEKLIARLTALQAASEADIEKTRKDAEVALAAAQAKVAEADKTYNDIVLKRNRLDGEIQQRGAELDKQEASVRTRSKDLDEAKAKLAAERAAYTAESNIRNDKLASREAALDERATKLRAAESQFGIDRATFDDKLARLKQATAGV